LGPLRFRRDEENERVLIFNVYVVLLAFFSMLLWLAHRADARD
jgi:hypothetical protein